MILLPVGINVEVAGKTPTRRYTATTAKTNFAQKQLILESKNQELAAEALKYRNPESIYGFSTSATLP